MKEEELKKILFEIKTKLIDIEIQYYYEREWGEDEEITKRMEKEFIEYIKEIITGEAKIE